MVLKVLVVVSRYVIIGKGHACYPHPFSGHYKADDYAIN